jgi:hypothetical protein
MKEVGVERTRVWRVGAAMVVVLGAAYAILDTRLMQGDPSIAAWVSSGEFSLATAVQSAFQSTSAGNVPDAAVAAITNHVGQVQGLNELVVTPADTGQGYDVSATVDLGENPAVSYAAWSKTVKQDVPAYFQDVFGSGQPVQEAEVYFLLDGNLVAGAALGASAYQALGTEVSTSGASQSAWVSTLASEPVVEDAGPNTRWFELEPFGGD